MNEEGDKKEGGKTLADYVREVGIESGWPEEYIVEQCSKVWNNGCYVTSSPEIYQTLWKRIREEQESGETQSEYSCEFNQNIEEEQLRWGEKIGYRRIGDPEWTITENSRSEPMTQIPTGNDKYKIRVTKLSVIPPGEAIFSEQATHVEIEDQAGGEYLSIQQNHEESRTQIFIDRKQWPPLRDAIDFMIGECRDN